MRWYVCCQCAVRTVHTVLSTSRPWQEMLRKSNHDWRIRFIPTLFISPNPHCATSQVQKWKLHVYPCKTTEQHSGNYILKSACHSKKRKTNKNKTKKHVKPDQWNHGGWKCTNYRRYLSYKWYRRSCIFSSNFANYIPTDDIVRQTIIFYYYLKNHHTCGL